MKKLPYLDIFTLVLFFSKKNLFLTDSNQRWNDVIWMWSVEHLKNIEKMSGGLEHSFFQFFQKILVIFSKTEGDSRESVFIKRGWFEIIYAWLLVDFTLTIKIEYFYIVSATCAELLEKPANTIPFPLFETNVRWKKTWGVDVKFKGRKSYES